MNFLHHYTHKDFIIEGTSTNYNLGDLLNFLPLDNNLIGGERQVKQKLFIHGFIGSYKGFSAGKGICFTIKEDQGMENLEIFDKSDFIPLALTYSGTSTIVYEEVAVKGLHNQTLPHGAIDLVSFTRTEKDSALALLSCQDRLGASIKCSHLTSTTVKNLTSYSSIGSERQAIVELLSFSQVVRQSNPNIQCFIMLKVCRQCFKPYFYLPQYDTLLRTKSDISLHSTSASVDDQTVGHDPIGSFILSLILHHLYNTKLFEHLDKMKCGWVDSYASSKEKFAPYLYPQRYTAKIATAETAQNFPSSKKFWVDQYSDFDFEI